MGFRADHRSYREDIASVLVRYQRGQIDALEVEAWADLIEARDDIEFALTMPR